MANEFVFFNLNEKKKKNKTNRQQSLKHLNSNYNDYNNTDLR